MQALVDAGLARRRRLHVLHRQLLRNVHPVHRTGRHVRDAGATLARGARGAQSVARCSGEGSYRAAMAGELGAPPGSPLRPFFFFFETVHP